MLVPVQPQVERREQTIGGRGRKRRRRRKITVGGGFVGGVRKEIFSPKKKLLHFRLFSRLPEKLANQNGRPASFSSCYFSFFETCQQQQPVAFTNKNEFFSSRRDSFLIWNLFCFYHASSSSSSSSSFKSWCTHRIVSREKEKIMAMQSSPDQYSWIQNNLQDQLN